MDGFRTLDDIGNVKGKRVLVRVDLNVPVSDGKVREEEVEIRKRPVVREEVRVTKETREEEHTESAQVRKEDATIEEVVPEPKRRRSAA